MVIDGYEPDHDRKFPLGPDVVEECRAVDRLQPGNEDDWAPFFDPEDFNKRHGPLLLKDHALPQDDLKRWAERAVKLRQEINEHAKQYAEPDETVAYQDEEKRTMVGKKRSKAEHNVEGV